MDMFTCNVCLLGLTPPLSSGGTLAWAGARRRDRSNGPVMLHGCKEQTSPDETTRMRIAPGTWSL
jgi:hypothetical protein